MVSTFVRKIWPGPTIIALVGGILFFFQNCGQSYDARDNQISARSPFYEQRVRLLKVGSVQASEEKNTNLDQTKISVLIDNYCAIESCEVAPDASDSLTCQLLQDNEVIEDLKKGTQAYSSQIAAGSSEQQLEAELSSNSVDDDCIIGVSYNLTYKVDSLNVEPYTSNDPQANKQFHHQIINGDKAYNYFYNEFETPKIGVIDTGVQDYTSGARHEDLISHSNYDVTSSEYDANACEEVCHWHGTFVNHIIAARHNNSKGGYGILPQASIRNFQIGRADGSFSTTQLANALNRARYYNLDVLNLSLGGSSFKDFALEDGIINVINSGALVVVSAGNDAKNLGVSPYYPASYNYDGQINVGAASPEAILNTSDLPPYNENQMMSSIKRSSFSNYGSGIVHIAAPGTRIFGAMLNNTYGHASGTSFSAPMVTAAAGLVYGHLRAKGLDPSPQLVKTLILQGARIEDSMTEGSGTEAFKPFQNNRYLDIEKLAETIEAFTGGVEEQPGRIELVDSSARINGSTNQKEIVVTVNVRDATPEMNYTLRAYTNSAFLQESFTGITCSIVSTRQICEIVIPYNRILIDPHVYLAVTDADNNLISDITIPKDKINTGVKTESTIEGEIILASHFDEKFYVEGWACLKGFADAIEIEVRIDKPDGSLVKTLFTDRQGRGRYFDVCQAPEINFGFRYQVPDYYNNRELYFVAHHPETGKSKILKAFTHQPAYGENWTPQYQDFVSFDRQVYRNDINFKISNYKVENWQLTVSGTACSRNPYQPPAFRITMGVDGDDKFRLLKSYPALADKLPDSIYNTSVGQVQEAATIQTVGRRMNVRNDQAREVANVGSLSCCSGFSETHNLAVFNPMTSQKNWEYLLYRDEARNSGDGILTIVPDQDMGDGCRFPSGFTVNLNLRDYFKSVYGSSSVAYRSDVYTEQQILQIEEISDILPFLKLNSDIDINVDDINFDPNFFHFSLSPLFYKNPYYLTTSYQRFTSDLRSMFSNMASTERNKQRALETLNERIAASSDPENDPLVAQAQNSYDNIKFFESGVLISNYLKRSRNNPSWENIAKADLAANAERLKEHHLVYEVANQSIAPANQNLTTTYTSETFTIPAGSSKIFPVVFFDEGENFGYLNEDLKIQVYLNSTGLWYDMTVDQELLRQVDVTNEDGEIESTYFQGFLSGPNRIVDSNATQIRLRVLSNNKNKFKLKSLGYLVE